MNRHLIFAVVLSPILACLGKASLTSVEGHFAEGRNLEAYEAAARWLRSGGDKNGGHLTLDKWAKVENYTVTFEGERDGCYVMHFIPHFEKAAENVLGYDPRYGLPFRFFIQKKNLKVVKVSLE